MTYIGGLRLLEVVTPRLLEVVTPPHVLTTKYNNLTRMFDKKILVLYSLIFIFNSGV